MSRHPFPEALKRIDGGGELLQSIAIMIKSAEIDATFVITRRVKLDDAPTTKRSGAAVVFKIHSALNWQNTSIVHLFLARQ